MKIAIIFAVIFSILALTCVAVYFKLDTDQKYANEHYEANCERIGGWSEYSYGCGENSCKYCNGKTVEGTRTYNKELSEEFVYYQTASKFKGASLVGAIVSTCGIGLTLIVTIIVKNKEAIKKAFKEE